MPNDSTYKRVLVAGLGRSGAASLKFLCTLESSFLKEIVAVADDFNRSEIESIFDVEGCIHGAKLYKTKEFEIAFKDAEKYFDICVISPGISPQTELYKLCQKHSVELISEIEFAYRSFDRQWVAITGTNGKTTTTALLSHLLNTAGIKAESLGNIGYPAIELAAKPGIKVAELSSFQLHTVNTLKPIASAILNITPDHLDWHAGFENYAADKARIFANQGKDDLIILNGDEEESQKLVPLAKKTGAKLVLVKLEDSLLNRWVKEAELLIKGEHNVFNATVAALIASKLGLNDSQIREGLMSFKAVSHRLEYAGDALGAAWYNDSKATNPDATMKALKAFEGEKLFLLLGGRNKGNSFVDLAKHALDHNTILEVFCFGESAEDIMGDFLLAKAEKNLGTKDFPLLSSYATLALALEAISSKLGESESAATTANTAASANNATTSTSAEVVLLSPANASFDEFDSFEHRGEVFKDFVENLASDTLSLLAQSQESQED